MFEGGISQELHTQSIAASIANESNSYNGFGLVRPGTSTAYQSSTGGTSQLV